VLLLCDLMLKSLILTPGDNLKLEVLIGEGGERLVKRGTCKAGG